MKIEFGKMMISPLILYILTHEHENFKKSSKELIDLMPIEQLLN